MNAQRNRRKAVSRVPSLHETIDPQWREWGPYLSERQWGTVREDYSEHGEAWDFFPHDHARSRAYRWGEDGLLGISDRKQRLCFALALWNGEDPILKERLFGLTGSEGNHGEDVKEYYYYLDATPAHTYLKGLYKYPQRAFPYGDLVSTNRSRGRLLSEYELIDTGIFADDRYFDVVVEYAKFSPTDIGIRISATNCGPEPATLRLLPTLWFRNTWSWGENGSRPSIARLEHENASTVVAASHDFEGTHLLAFEDSPQLLFTENETNAERLWGGHNATPYVKDGINATIVDGCAGCVNPEDHGTKVAGLYQATIRPGETEVIRLRLSREPGHVSLDGIDELIATRVSEADALYASLAPETLTEDERSVQRQALAGLIWTKQYYEFDVARWIDGDSSARPPSSRKSGRNSRWRHHRSSDVISMPDKWEYPWYAAWDLAFHCIAFGLIDPQFAKDQLLLLTEERYMHPNGQLPAYEWAFGDVNPPVHIAAARAIYLAERKRTGSGDREFLERIFHKLLLNFTWWVNRKDPEDNNLFEGGFLGLDNISIIDRSAPLPSGLRLEQSDGTAWMATYCLGMAWAAIELARENAIYEDLAITFFQHYMTIADAINGLSDPTTSLWNEEDGFYYDTVRRSDGQSFPLRLRSLVGLLPIIPSIHASLNQKTSPGLSSRLREYVGEYRIAHPHLATLMPERVQADGTHMQLFTLLPEDRLKRTLRRMLDPSEFLGDFGIRSISRYYLDRPFEVDVRDTRLRVQYEPAESSTGMFGGNSNWRGPVWIPVNFLLVQGLRNLDRYYQSDFRVEYPTGSGHEATLGQIADDLSRRLVASMLRDEDGRRPVFGGNELMQRDPRWRDHLFFYEYFHGDNGAGIGASHQTGWTALLANLLGSRNG